MNFLVQWHCEERRIDSWGCMAFLCPCNSASTWNPHQGCNPKVPRNEQQQRVTHDGANCCLKTDWGHPTTAITTLSQTQQKEAIPGLRERRSLLSLRTFCLLLYRVPEKDPYRHWMDDLYKVFTNNCLNKGQLGKKLKNQKLNKLCNRIMRFQIEQYLTELIIYYI